MPRKKKSANVKPVEHTKEIVQEFINFLTSKNVLAMAVGLIVADTVRQIVGILVDGIIRPFIALFLVGGAEFGAFNIKIGKSVFRFGDLFSALLQAFIVFVVLYLVFVKVLKKSEVFEG